MEIKGQAVLLRIFIGESDKVGHQPLHEVIVRKAREEGLAGRDGVGRLRAYASAEAHMSIEKAAVVAGIGQPNAPVRSQLQIMRRRQTAQLVHHLAIAVGDHVVGPGAGHVDHAIGVHQHALRPR